MTKAVHSHPHPFTTQEYSLTFIHSYSTNKSLFMKKKKESSTETALIKNKKKNTSINITELPLDAMPF